MDLMRNLRTAGWEVQDFGGDRPRKQGVQIRVGDIGAVRTFQAAPAPERPDRTRPFLKIQDGCDFACTFCIIPAVRGPNRSLPPDRVVEEGRRLAAGGHPEIVLTGINLGTYGWDLRPKMSLSALLRRLLDETPIPRIRLSSLHPHEIKPEMVRLFGASPRLCRNVHLALQSGDDEVLRRMARSYRSRHFRDVVERLSHEVPGIAIGVDVIVGFPGETEAAFENTRRLLEELPVSYFHVFTYSRRSDTKAAGMPDQVPSEAKARRNRTLRQLGEQKFLAFKQSFIGHTLPVVVLGERDCETGLLHGVSDNYLGVLLGGPDVLRGRLVDVRVEGMGGRGMLCGRVLTRGSVPQPPLQRALPLVVGC
jgi:threonylcarbamoyladenosine tRNA methylthiotransferase MtaB